MGRWRLKKRTKKFTNRQRESSLKNKKLSDYVPDSVLTEILTHIETETKKTESNYFNLKGKEDTITGGLFNSLKTDWRKYDDWQWKIDFQISCISAKGEFNENETGADGLISININQKGETKTKLILFQAKKKGNRKDLETQIKKMDETLEGGNMIIIYSEKGFFAQTANKYTIDDEIKFTDYLKDVFFACKSGHWGNITFLTNNRVNKLDCLNINVKEE